MQKMIDFSMVPGIALFDWYAMWTYLVYCYALDSVSEALGSIESCQMQYSNSYQFDKFMSRSHRITTRWLHVRVHIKYSWQD